MSCFEVTPPSLPSIPGLTIPLPSFGIPNLSLTFCCQFQLPIALTVSLPPIPIPPALITAINLLIKGLNAYLALLDFSIDCPFNDS